MKSLICLQGKSITIKWAGHCFEDFALLYLCQLAFKGLFELTRQPSMAFIIASCTAWKTTEIEGEGNCRVSVLLGSESVGCETAINRKNVLVTRPGNPVRDLPKNLPNY